MPIRILVVDDHFMVRAGLRDAFSSESDLNVVGEAISGTDAIKLHRELQPDVTVLDVRLPDKSGVEVLKEIRRHHSEARILMLSTYDGDEDIYQSLTAGALAYVRKDVQRSELLRAVREVAEGKRYIPSEIASRIAERLSRPELTQRERDVLERLVAGRANKQIATELGLSEITVKMHVSHILDKLGVKDRTQAALAAVKHGLVHPGWFAPNP